MLKMLFCLCTWLFSHTAVVGCPLQVCRPIKGDGMLLEDDGPISGSLDSVQDDGLAAF